MHRSLIPLTLCLAFSAIAPVNAGAIVGRKIDGFTLRDFRGKEHSLSQYAGKPVAVVFIGAECPLAKNYAPRLEQIYQQFKKQGVQVLAVNSNRQDTITKIGAYAARHGVTFPVLKDPDNSVADLFQATRTPHAFLLDGTRVIRYAGRIDDQYGLGETSGYVKPKLEESYLVTAITEVLAGRKVTQEVTTPTGCIIGRGPKIRPHGDITYTKHVSRILNRHCVSCHRKGEIAPFPLTSFEEASGWGEMIVEVMDKGQMPPWFANPAHGKFSNDARMSEGDKQTIRQWVANGCLEGNSRDLPEPQTFVEGWQIDEPDEVIFITDSQDRKVDVKAEGVVEYKYFEVDPGWTEDKYIKASQAKPDNREVVHHIIVYVIPPGSDRRAAFRSSIGGFAPGSPPRTYMEGVAMHVKPGTKLLFEMHYTPNGSPQKDRSSVGLVYADPSEVTRVVTGGVVGVTRKLKIPAGAPNHKVKAYHKFRNDVLLTSMLPHMHLRGKSFRYTAYFPNGKKETLLDVPKYDFNWQLRYDLAEPRLMPRGTVIEGIAVYDNSENNISNPAPEQDVYYGEQTFEEMMFGFFDTVPVRQRKQ